MLTIALMAAGATAAAASGGWGIVFLLGMGAADIIGAYNQFEDMLAECRKIFTKNDPHACDAVIW